MNTNTPTPENGRCGDIPRWVPETARGICRLPAGHQGWHRAEDNSEWIEARSNVLDEVAQERARQDAKWGEQNHPNGTGPTWTSLNRRDDAQRDCEYAAEQGNVTYRHILAEEYYEALAEDDPSKLRAELLQVAAVAVAWVEKIDRAAARGGAR